MPTSAGSLSPLAPAPRAVASAAPPGAAVIPRPASAAPADPASKAPPGFAGPHIVAAESATLVALDPVEDETTAPPPPAATIETIGGSALLAKAAGLARLRPRKGDLALVGRDRQASLRIGATALVALLLLVVVGPPLARLLSSVPVLGTMIAQLESFTLLPGAYGKAVFVVTFGAITAAGIVVAQMEKTAHVRGTRSDPTTRLNIALAGLLALAIAGAAMALGRDANVLEAGASVSLFLAACLAIPLGNLPGGRAMAHQPARAWALLAALAVGGMIVQPSFPMLAIAIVTLLRVRTTWPAISGREDAFTDGPIDHTNRLSALIIVAFVIFTAAIGMRATTAPPVELRNGPSLIENGTLPGAEQGPTVAPPTLP